MTALKNIFQAMNFENSTTYIQSGNVVFESSLIDKNVMANLISNQIKKEYDYTVPVIIKTSQEMQFIVQNNPFLTEEIDTKKLYIVFLYNKPIDTKSLEIFDIGEDTYQITDDIIYIKYAIGAGKTKLTIALIERKLKITATARNWRTSNKLAEM